MPKDDPEGGERRTPSPVAIGDGIAPESGGETSPPAADKISNGESDNNNATANDDATAAPKGNRGEEEEVGKEVEEEEEITEGASILAPVASEAVEGEASGERDTSVADAQVEIGEGDVVRIGGREVRIGGGARGGGVEDNNVGDNTNNEGDGAPNGGTEDENLGRVPKYYDEDAQHPNWVKHKKHILIFSAAGKPIFSRYGNESKLSGTTCVLQAFVSFVEDQGDELQCFIAGDYKFVFLLRGAVYLAAISRTEEPVFYLRRQLAYLYDQILFVLTSGMDKVFKSNPSFDLRGLLGGTENLFTSLIHLTNIDPSFLLGSVPCLPLPPQVRAQIGSVLHAARAPEMLYAVLLCGTRLVSLVRPKRHQLHTDDLLLIRNMVMANQVAFRRSDSWAPLCLPAFNDRGFVYAHVSYLARDVCLLLVTTQADQFPALQGFKTSIARGLADAGAIEAIERAAQASLTCEDLGVPQVRHFLYKARSTHQLLAPRHSPPYVTRRDRKRLLRLYQDVYGKVHHLGATPMPAGSLAQVRPNHKVYYVDTGSEAILAWVSSEFELYASLGPFVGKQEAVRASTALTKAIKAREDSLFILHAPVWT